jgi:hypothetical protein
VFRQKNGRDAGVKKVVEQYGFVEAKALKERFIKESDDHGQRFYNGIDVQ